MIKQCSYIDLPKPVRYGKFLDSEVMNGNVSFDLEIDNKYVYTDGINEKLLYCSAYVTHTDIEDVLDFNIPITSNGEPSQYGINVFIHDVYIGNIRARKLANKCTECDRLLTFPYFVLIILTPASDKDGRILLGSLIFPLCKKVDTVDLRNLAMDV